MTGRGSLPAPLPTGSSSKAPERDVGPAQTPYRIAPGRPLPLGVHDCCDGFNFAVFSRHAERVELLLFDDATAGEPALVIDLDPVHHRTGDIWHTLVEGVRWGQTYAYRVYGRWAPEEGHRFDGRVLLLDPYALAVSTLPAPDETPHTAAVRPAAASGRRCVLVNRRFDWQGTTRPKTPWSETVIYETHVRGLTIDPSAGSKYPGTYLGVIEKIPYFLELGITSVEFMPVQEFDAGGDPLRDPATGRLLRNYWGYNTVAFFAPHRAYREGFALECRAIRRLREEMGFRNVVVMIPFCRSTKEADRVIEVMAENGLRRGENGLEVYVMCEIPSNVVLAKAFAELFDGFSIGSNDLTQLTLGVDRDSDELAELFDEQDEAVKWMIRTVIEAAHRSGAKVGLCGQAPSDHPAFAEFLVACGIDSMSVSPDSFIAVKRHVATAEAER